MHATMVAMFRFLRPVTATVVIALLVACAGTQRPAEEQEQMASGQPDRSGTADDEVAEHMPPEAVTRALPPGEPAEAPAEAAAKASAEAESPEPAQKQESYQPLSKSELTEQALALSPGNTTVVRDDGSRVAVYHDVQGNGLVDVAVVSVEGLPHEEATLQRLSNMSRLFDNRVTVPGFYVEVYGQSPEGVKALHTIFLGRKAVFSSFTKIAISRQKELPVALSALFYSSNGQEQNWTTFAEGGEVSHFVIQDTPTVENRIVDINNDGVLDVIEYRSGFEEGRGYETFVTWFRWSGTSFSRHRTTNIVRNLNAFLAGIAERVRKRQWQSFVELALTPEQRKSLGPEVSAEEVVRRVVEPLRSELEGDEPDYRFLADNVTMTDVVLPDILENPFPSVEGETSFVAPMRIVCCDGDTQYYSVQVVMQRNPFSERQFYLELQSN